MDIITDHLYKPFNDSYIATDAFLDENPLLKSQFDDLYSFASHILSECFPSDIDSIRKVWWFPVVEAGLELEYSLFFAKAGIYKTAYMALRNSLELSLTCFHFLLMKKAKGNDWVKGHTPTPFKHEILSGIFENEDFFNLDQHISIKARIETAYRTLNDICHTRGRPHSHMELSKANYPRFTAEALQNYILTTRDVVDLVITCFIGVNPIILYPIPVEEKFGVNGPMSGYLQEPEVERLRRLLKPDSLQYLLRYYDKNQEVQSQREYFADLPDITEAEVREQFDEFERFIADINSRNAQPSVAGSP